MSIRIVREKIDLSELNSLAKEGFGDMVKAVVDLGRDIMAVGGELHSDEEAVLLDDGSQQTDLWGINLYPDAPEDEWIEYDSMINVRPSQGNASRGVQSPELQQSIRRIVELLVSR